MTRITVVHENGSDIIDIDDEHFVEEVNLVGENGQQAIRVWHEDPDIDDSAYTDYQTGTVVEVYPDNMAD